jgi:hypothetical protein
VFSGYKWGMYTRRQAKLAQCDRDPNTTVSIVIPVDTMCLSPTFIRGMLGPSVRKLGDKFSSKYQVVVDADRKTEYFATAVNEQVADLLRAPKSFRVTGILVQPSEDNEVVASPRRAGRPDSAWN